MLFIYSLGLVIKIWVKVFYFFGLGFIVRLKKVGCINIFILCYYKCELKVVFFVYIRIDLVKFIIL